MKKINKIVKVFIFVYICFIFSLTDITFASEIDADASNEASASVVIENVNTVSGVFDVVISNVQAQDGVQKVVVPIWSQTDQSDIMWYEAEKRNDGTYYIHVDVANHNCNFEKFQVHTYILSNAGNLQKVDEKNVDVYSPESEISLSVKNKDTLVLKAWHVPGTFGKSLSNVSFAVWNEKNDQDDLRWYTGNASEDLFVVDIPIQNHGIKENYIIHLYATYSNGMKQFVGSRIVEVGKKASADIAIENVNTVSGCVDVAISNVSAFGDAQQILVPIWSQPDQSDLVWYEAIKQGDGTYRVHMDLANHNCNFDKYQVHTYIKNGYGELEQVGAVAVPLYSPQTIVNATVTDTGSKVTIDAWHVPGTLGKSLNGVSFAVWSDENAQDDLQWYAGTLSGDKYITDIALENHKAVGCYHVHVYAHKANGVSELVATYAFERPLTRIMGDSQVTIEQMVQFFSSRAEYPTYYESTDASTLEEFCKIYLEECSIEGVRAEVAFSQAMLETGFLKFGGDVDISQNNFAGIGATGGGNSGNSFSSVREGVRAQVQHLKAYASSEALVQECVDPRFTYVRRETAPYVEWLGIKENPYGTGWAASEKYGYTMRDNYIYKLCNP